MLRTLTTFSLMILIATGMVSCTSCKVRQVTDASQVQPLLIGADVPAIALTTVDGQAVTIPALAKEKPAVVIFYRGGWCPYCNKHLQEMATIEGDLQDLGYQVLAVSPDLPAKLKDTADQDKLGYTLLSDNTMELAQAMGIAYQLDEPTLAKYKGYGIDLEDASGKPHHMLPVPSVFIVDSDGRIAFEYVNPDYAVRLSGEVLLAAARAVGGK